MGQIYVCGDLHGHIDLDKLSNKNFPEQKELNKEDVMIQCGDFGFIWYHNEHPKLKKDIHHLDELSKKNYTFCFVDGNHENFDRLYEYPIIEKWGGKVREVHPNIFWLLRGEIYNINGKIIWTFGGARSNEDQKEYNYKGKGRNKKLRKQLSWWPQEIPSVEEFEYGKQKLIENNWKVDYVITHTCPSEVIKEMYHKTGIGNYSRLDDPVSIFLEEIEDNLTFKEWHFGHFHQDIDIETKWGKYCCHYNNPPTLLP